jgi:GGDEF domain-containing protein
MGEAIRSAIGTHYSDSGTPTPSASVGWAVFPEDGEDVESLIRAADERMLRSKRRGESRPVSVTR